MTSKREQVAQALFALIAAAVPGATVLRNADKPEEIPEGGLVILRDGDPGQPEVDLSPLTYNYNHRFELEAAAIPSGGLSKEQVLDQTLSPIGAAVRADRTLGGLCEWLEAEAPVSGEFEAEGADAARWAELAILAVYSTTDALN